MEAVLWEWLNLAVRWTHLIAGIAWIGGSFYFVHTDSGLKRREGLPEGAGGETWQVHGGGFYHIVKYLVAPARLIVHALAVIAAVLLSVLGLAAGWLAYDRLCESPLGRDDVKLGLATLGFVVVSSLVFSFLFSARGAFMEMGALVGTIMVANVAMVIMPNQRKVVADLMAGRQPDPKLGAQAKQRSLHNNYFTLGVLFVMIGNHYPLAFAGRWNWLIFALVLVIGALIRHFYNTRHQGLPSPWWTWGAAAAGMVLVMLLSAVGPAGNGTTAAPPSRPATFARVEEIVLSRCSMCHNPEPGGIYGLHVPPKGVLLDTPERIRAYAPAIALNAVRTHAMPPGNLTEMTPEERQVLAAWLAAGAPGS